MEIVRHRYTREVYALTGPAPNMDIRGDIGQTIPELHEIFRELRKLPDDVLIGSIMLVDDENPG